MISMLNKGSLLAILILATATVGCQGKVTIPDVVGTPQAEGESVITQCGLTVGTVASRHSDTITAGNILGQKPSAGTAIPIGGTVDIEVSIGPAAVVVPEVTGMTVPDATAALTAVGCAAGEVSPVYTSASEDVGTIAEQSPTASQMVPPGTLVNLLVAEDDTPLRGFLESFAEEESTGLADLEHLGEPAMRFLINQFTAFDGPDDGAAAAAALHLICSENRELAVFAARELVGEMEACYTVIVTMQIATAETKAAHPHNADVSALELIADNTQGKLAISATVLALLGDAAVQAINDRLAANTPVFPVDTSKTKKNGSLSIEQVSAIAAEGTREFHTMLTRWRDEIAITGDNSPEHALHTQEQDR